MTIRVELNPETEARLKAEARTKRDTQISMIFMLSFGLFRLRMRRLFELFDHLADSRGQ